MVEEPFLKVIFFATSRFFWNNTHRLFIFIKIILVAFRPPILTSAGIY